MSHPAGCLFCATLVGSCPHGSYVQLGPLTTKCSSAWVQPPARSAGHVSTNEGYRWRSLSATLLRHSGAMPSSVL